jgi:hypothetical protein
MILHKNILILEDDLRTLSKILERLASIEEDQPYEFTMVILTTYLQVEEYINKNPKTIFDMVLLDRDCKLGGSFHVLDIERMGPAQVIAISSVPKWNREAEERGVRRIVEKDYSDLDGFATRLADEVTSMLKTMKPSDRDMHHIS